MIAAEYSSTTEYEYLEHDLENQNKTTEYLSTKDSVYPLLLPVLLSLVSRVHRTGCMQCAAPVPGCDVGPMLPRRYSFARAAVDSYLALPV